MSHYVMYKCDWYNYIFKFSPLASPEFKCLLDYIPTHVHTVHFILAENSIIKENKLQ